MKIANIIPIILAIFTLKTSPNVNCTTLKSNEIGSVNPKDSP